MEILRADGISHKYTDEYVIRDISLSLNEGEIIAILGVSGAGKTTLFQTLSGLVNPSEGHIFLRGKEITGETGHLSYMLQKDLLLEHKTIEDNVSLPLVLKGTKKEDARKQLSGKWDEFGIEGTEKLYPAQLSGGMRQRAALLRTYMCGNEISLLDEPFSALDAITRTKLHAWYLSLIKKMNLSIIFITHDVDEAIYLADRILIMSGKPGTITREIKTPPKAENENYLLSDGVISLKREIISALT